MFDRGWFLVSSGLSGGVGMKKMFPESPGVQEVCSFFPLSTLWFQARAHCDWSLPVRAERLSRIRTLPFLDRALRR